MRKLQSLSFLFIFLILGCNLYEAPPTPVPPITSNDFLAGSKYDKLILEILYEASAQPSSVTVDNIKAFLQQRLTKPGGITVVQNGTGDQGKDVYFPSDLVTIETSGRTQHNTGSTLTLFIFFANGENSSNTPTSKTFAITMSPTSIVVFEKSILNYAGNAGQPPIVNLETTATTHQLGHLLGLVSNGSPMIATHEDTNHAKHCDESTCLMYFDFITNEGVAKVLANGIPVLNTNCLNDLKGNGGL